MLPGHYKLCPLLIASLHFKITLVSKWSLRAAIYRPLCNMFVWMQSRHEWLWWGQSSSTFHAPDTSMQRPSWLQLLLLFEWELRVREDFPKLYSIPVWGNTNPSSYPWPQWPQYPQLLGWARFEPESVPPYSGPGRSHTITWSACNQMVYDDS